MLKKLGISPRITATEAPWQNGLVERHGQVLAEIVRVTIEQSQLAGAEDMRLAGVMAGTAKNRRPDRTGHSARTRVFGVADRFPGGVIDMALEGTTPGELDCVHEPVMRKATRMRADALSALSQMDADRRWKKAIVSGVRRQIEDWKPGDDVHFWRNQRDMAGTCCDFG